MAGERKIAAKVSIGGADLARQDLKTIQDSLEKMGGKGLSAASQITKGFENIQKAADDVERKIQQGSAVTERDGKKMIQQWFALEQQIKAAFGSIDNAPAEIQEAFKVAGAQFDATKNKVRLLTDEVSDMKGQLKEGGEQWTGFGDAINKALGPMGKMQAQAALTFAAFSQGWQVGHNIAEKMGTDFSTWNTLLDTAAKKAGGFVSELSDAAVRLFTEGVGGMKESLDTAGAALSLGADGLKGYKLALQLGLKDIDNYTAKERELADLAKFVADAEAAGGDAIKLKNELIAQNGKSLEQLSEAIRKHAPDMDAIIKKVEAEKQARNEVVEAQKKAKEAISTIIQALKDEQAARDGLGKSIEDEKLKYEQWNKALEEARKVQVQNTGAIGGYTDEQKKLLEQLQSLIPVQSQHSKELAIFADALAKTTEYSQTLNESQKAHIKEITDGIAKYGELGPVQRGRIQSLIDEEVRNRNAAEAQNKASDAVVEFTKKADGSRGAISNTTESLNTNAVAIENVEGGLKKLTNYVGGEFTGAMQDFGVALDSSKKALPDYNEQLRQMDQHLIDIAQHARDAANGIGELANSGGSNQYPSDIGPPVSHQYNTPIGPAPASKGTPGYLPGNPVSFGNK